MLNGDLILIFLHLPPPRLLAIRGELASPSAVQLPIAVGAGLRVRAVTCD